jgi:hypothetical protein
VISSSSSSLTSLLFWSSSTSSTSPSSVSSHDWVVAAPFSCGYGIGGSVVVAAAASFRVATFSAVATAAVADGSALSLNIFDFFGGMISSSNNHGGRHYCSRPKPSNTGLPQRLART